ncbi:alpha-1,4-glucan branching enzyme [Puccinia graminis f. sp. tritici]|nr:alpha-1,4-glucan branching enzyme [Puccinia graminis f. sp. tritici]
MKKDQFGVWECRVPPKGSQPGIAHGSKVKISMIAQSGERIERLPAWIRFMIYSIYGSFAIST